MLPFDRIVARPSHHGRQHYHLWAKLLGFPSPKNMEDRYIVEVRLECFLHGRTAAESLEFDFADDLCLGVNLDVQPHDVAALYIPRPLESTEQYPY